MKSPFLPAGLIAGLAIVGLAGAASAATPKDSGQNCFLSTQWDGWRAPDEKTLYLRVNLNEIFRIDLSSGSPMLKWPDAHLVNVVRGSDYICSPLDLQLSVAESGPGDFKEFLIAKTLTKLTPEQIAAIPKKDLP